MLSDFEMLVKQFPENKDIKIIPISDVHLGAAEHLKKEWNDFCKWILDQPDTYITLGGDLINNALKSSVSNVYEETMPPSEQKRIMAEMLKPLKDRILCAVTGNHEARSIKEADDDPTYDIMCKLDIEEKYRRNMAFLKLQIGKQEANGLKNPTYIIAVIHGCGGGTTGAAVNKFEKFGYVIDGADILITGHTHKPFNTHPSKIKIDSHNNKITMKPFEVICSTSWLGYGGYALNKMLTPSTFVPQIITLRGDKKKIYVTSYSGGI